MDLDLNILSRLAESQGGMEIGPFAFSVFLSYLLSILLSRVYIKYSKTLSNPRSLAKVFPLLSIATTIIIAVIKSSLALSLGLVGALSIVRFRTPIKEPEELVYLFFSIGLGLACGASQYKIAITGLFITSICIFILDYFTKKSAKENTLRVLIDSLRAIDVNDVIKLVSEYSNRVNFHNMLITNNESENNTSISISIIPNEFFNVNELAVKINKIYPDASISIIDSNSI